MNRSIFIVVTSIVFFTVLSFAAEKKPTTGPVGFEKFEERIAGTLVKFEMLPIPAGKIRFAIDDKSPPHEVQIKPFWMAKTECTWDEYDVFFLRLDLDKDDRRPFLVDRNGTRTRPSLPYDAPDQGFGHSGYPAISLTAHAGKIYCKWLSEKSGRKYRLPTPAEWEYACRAGAADLKADDNSAWTKDNSPKQTQPVAKKRPNAFGLYDMLGNAGEWTITADQKDEFLCGGSYLNEAREILPSRRERLKPEWYERAGDENGHWWWLSDAPFAGFRVVCDP